MKLEKGQGQGRVGGRDYPEASSSTALGAQLGIGGGQVEGLAS